MLNGLFLLALIDILHGLDFNSFIQVRNRTLNGVESTFPTRVFTTCIEQCGLRSDCVSATYSETNSSCLIHKQHPIQEDATLMVTPGNTLYYSLECPIGWHRFGMKCYLFSSNALSWHNSKSYCASIGGNIVKIETADEQEFIKNIAALNSGLYNHYWIGAFWSTSDNAFLWYDGTSIEYDAWGGTNPNIFTGCVDIASSIGWKWNDHVDCGSALEYICEKNLIIK